MSPPGIAMDSKLSPQPQLGRSRVTHSPFLNLPTEVIQHIAALTSSDRDLCSLISTCRTMASILIHPRSGVWRGRFRALYDPPHDKTSEEIKVEYQIRSLVLRQTVTFHRGVGPEQEIWLEIVKTLLTESFPYSHGPQTEVALTSKNLKKLIDIFSESDFMNRPVVRYEQCSIQRPTDTFAAIQLCLTHIAICPEMGYLALRTDYDIAAVYKYGLPRLRIFVPNKVHLEQLLHIRNFWKRHLTNPDEATFYDSYKGLSPGRRPRGWSFDLSANRDLGSCWLGYYSCIHPYPKSLSALEERQTCGDLDSHWTIPYLISLDLSVNHSDSSWPKLFDSALPLHTNVPEINRRFFHGRQGFDNIVTPSQGFVTGFTEELPPQGDIPGWRRICFVICEVNVGSLPSTMEVGQELPAEEWLFLTGSSLTRGYEGIVIPGGKIMLGRWFDMTQSGEISCDGPFIFWSCECG